MGTRILIVENIWKSRQTSTVKNYCIALRRFFSYLNERDIEILAPFDSLTIANYLTFLIVNNGTRGALTTAVCSLRWFQAFLPGMNKVNLPINETFIDRLVESVNRTKARCKKRKHVLPESLVKAISRDLPENALLKDLRDALVPLFQFSLLLRHRELTSVCLNHITEDWRGLNVFIPAAKNDVYREGRFVLLSRRNFRVFELFFRYLKRAKLKLGLNHFLFCSLSYDKKSKANFVLNKKISIKYLKGRINILHIKH